MIVGIVGICATLFILASMSFKTTTLKSSIIMRVLNIIGSVAFVFYGAFLPAISTAILNACLVVVNTYHLVMLIIEYKKQNKVKDKKEEVNTESNKSSEM